MRFLEAYYLIGVMVLLVRLLILPAPKFDLTPFVEKLAKDLEAEDPGQFYGEEEELLGFCRIMIGLAAVIAILMSPLYWPTTIMRWKR